MRFKVCYIILFLTVCSLVQAQVFKGTKANALVSGSELVKIDSVTGLPSFIQFKANILSLQASSQPTTFLHKALGLSSLCELKSQSTETDQFGHIHTRYTLMMNGIPIEGMRITTHSSNGILKSVSGRYTKASPISQKAAISPVQAIAYAQKILTNQTNDTVIFRQATPSPTRVWLMVDDTPQLCYKVDVYLAQPLMREYIYVSVKNGAILKRVSRLHNTDVQGNAMTLYSGTKSITAEYYLGNYRLREVGRGSGIMTYNMNNGLDYGSAVDFTDADNQWDSQNDRQAYEAHYGAEATYDFLLERFNRQSIDNKGMALESFVHYGTSYNNAFWDGECMSYGDGNGTTYKPFTSIDIIGHEITHGLTTYTANLEYLNEPGALNEGFSDIFAVAIDFWANPQTANFQIGEQIAKDGTPFRDLSNPSSSSQPDTYQGTFWYSGTNDYGGVHQNSSVLGYWFYLLCNGGSGVNDKGNAYAVNAIGIDQATNIAYRTLAYYLTPYSDYSEARDFTLQAAIDLYGVCSAQVIAVTNAWYAVGLGEAFSGEVKTQFTADHTFSCSAPASFKMKNSSTNATAFEWSLNGELVSTLAEPVITINQPGTYNVSLKVYGASSCNGEDTQLRNGYLTIDTGSETPVPSSTPTSISPGEASIASVSVNNHLIANNNLSTVYLNFTCNEQIILTEGAQCNFAAVTATQKSAMAYFWLDINNDGQFDASGEFLGSFKTTSSGGNGNFYIPTSSFKNQPLRMRIGTDGTAYLLRNGNTASHTGQYMDVTVFVQANQMEPVATFNAGATQINPGQTIQFIDNSSNLPQSYHWYFPGGEPSSSTEANPYVTYNNNGIYNVSLKVTNSFGSDSIGKTGFITVSNEFKMGQLSQASSVSGTLYDSGGASGNYGSNENKSFLIAPTCINSLSLTLEMVETESGFDYLKVYDGTSSSSPLLSSYDGTLAAPVTLNSSTGKLYITFSSDGSENRRGFKANWQTTPRTDANPVEAAFAISDANPPVGSTITFTDQSTNTPYDWFWDFGDNSYSRAAVAAHQYNAPGNYQITLRAVNCGSQASISKNIVVKDYPQLTLGSSAIETTLTTGAADTLTLTLANAIGAGTLNYNASVENYYYLPSQSLTRSMFNDTLKLYNGILTEAYKEIHYAVANKVTHSVTLAGKRIAIPAAQSSFYDMMADDLTARGAEMIFDDTQNIESQIANADVLLMDDYCVAVDATVVRNFVEKGGMLIIAGDDALSNFNAYLENTGITMVDAACAQGNASYIASNSYTRYLSQYQISANSLASMDVTNNDNILLRDANGLIYSAFASIGTGAIVVIGDELHSPLSYTLTGVSQFLYNIIVSSNISDNWINITPSQGTIAAGATSNMEVALNAGHLLEGTYMADISMTTNGINGNTTVPVKLNIIGVPSILSSTQSLNFDKTLIGAATRQSVRISNNGTALLTVSVNALQGCFNIGATTISLLPGEEMGIPVEFVPSAAGMVNDNLIITSNAPSNLTMKIFLTGEGLIPPAVEIAPASIVKSLYSDETEAINIVISNKNGGSNLEIKDVYLQNFTRQTAVFDTVKVSLQGISVAYSGESDTRTNVSDLLVSNMATFHSLGSEVNDDIVILAEATLTPAIIAELRDAIYNRGKGLWIENYAMSVEINTLLQGTGIQLISRSHNSTNVSTINTHQTTYNINKYNADYSQVALQVNGQATPLMGMANSSVVAACAEFGKGRIIVAPSLNGYHILQTGHQQLLMNGVRWLSGLNNWLWTSHLPVLTIAAGDSSSMHLLFDATGLSTGTYQSEVHITTNDPHHLEQSIPVTLHVTGVPVLQYNRNEIQFNCRFIGSVTTDSVLIRNAGAEVMVAQLSISGDNSFRLLESGFIIMPKESRYVKVQFAPTTASQQSANVTVKTNARINNSFNIALTGCGESAPMASINNQLVAVSLQPNMQATRMVRINNTSSQTPLTIETIITQNGLNETALPLETVRTSLIHINSAITTLVPGYYQFSEGETGTSIIDGGLDMYDNGNILSINNTILNYTNGNIVNESLLGSTGKYMTCKFPGLFVLAADVDNMQTFTIKGGLGADGEGSTTGTVFEQVSNGRTYMGFVKRVAGNSDPSVNHLIIVEKKGTPEHSFSTNTNSDFHEVTGLLETKRIYYLMFASKNGGYVSDDVFAQVMTTFLSGLWAAGIDWVTVTPAEASLNASLSMYVELNFSSAAKEAGLYEAVLRINTNDPLHPQFNIPLKMVVGDNISPTIIATLPDQTVKLGEAPINIDLTSLFNDPNGDALTYSLECTNCGCVSMSTSNSTLTISPVKTGLEQVTILSSDSKGGQNQLSFSVAVIDPLTGVETHASDKLHVAPNPSASFTNIYATAGLSWVLTDINGKLCLSGQTQKGSTPLDLSTLHSGIYLLKVEGFSVMKVVKK
jgi:Zn-dependent metalloprotease